MFWRRGYDVDTVRKNTKKYVNNQWKEDFVTDQIRFSEYIDSFINEKVKGNT